MSALAGVVGHPGHAAAVERLLRRMDARGPEARLSIPVEGGTFGVCVGSGGPPAWDVGRRWLVAVSRPPVNLRALRTELVARERAPADAGPAALAAAIVAEVGFERALTRLEGDVAVAAWDAATGTIHLARDRVGHTALHHRPLPAGGFAWSTDLGALALLDGPAAVSPEGVASLAVLGLVPPPGTVVSPVERLAAGTFLRRAGPSAAVARWWDAGVSPEGAGGAAPRWAKSVRLAVELAVRQRVGPDLATACGGGLYSATVAAMAGDDAGVRLRLGEGTTLTPGDLPGVLDEMAAGLGEPVVAPEAVGWWVLARAAWERGCTRLLTGLGGAAIFEVASRGRRARLAGALGLVDAPSPGWGRHHLAPGAEDPVWGPVDLLEAACPATSVDAAVPWLDRRLRLPDAGLAAAERACGAFGVELLAPLADPRLQSLAVSIPLEHHRAGGVPRALYTRAVADLLPTPPAPSAGPSLPLGAWLRGPATRLLDDLPERAADLVAPTHTRALVEGHRAGRFDATGRLWALLLVDRWLRVNTAVPRTRGSWADSRVPIE